MNVVCSGDSRDPSLTLPWVELCWDKKSEMTDGRVQEHCIVKMIGSEGIDDDDDEVGTRAPLRLPAMVVAAHEQAQHHR
jgi:hypothetical protein